MAKGSSKSGNIKPSASTSHHAVPAAAPHVAVAAPVIEPALLSTADDKNSWDDSVLDDNEYARFVTRKEEPGDDASATNGTLSTSDPEADVSNIDGDSITASGIVNSEDDSSSDVSSTDGSSSDGSSTDGSSSDGSSSDGSSSDGSSSDGSSTDGSSTDGSSTDGSSSDGSSTDGSSSDGSSTDGFSTDVVSEDAIAPDSGDWTADSSPSDWVDLSDSDPAAE